MSHPLSRRDLLGIGIALGTAGIATGCGSGAGEGVGDGETEGEGDVESDVSGPLVEDPDENALPTAVGPSGTGIPDPVDFLITRWRQDQFSFGSYSYLAVGADPSDRSTLAQPVADRLFFAGEATHRDHPSTVHGALLSGRQVALDVTATGASSVIVVGAGASGLGAAERLHQAGVDVHVVEGRDRIGGRVWSDSTLGATVDLGASWIHGVSGNPLTSISDEAGIQRLPSDYDNLVVYSDSREVLDVDDLPDEFVAVVEIEHDYAADVEALSPEATDEGDDVVGGDVVFPNGYREVLAQLETGFPISLNTTVIAIDTSGDTGNGKVIITTDAGTFEADAVVVTVPLGVLKAGSIEFSPPLPADKLGAIERLGMGLLDKVYLRFDEVFWDPDVEFFGFVGPDIDRFAAWLNLAFYTGEPILMAFNAGSAADAIELQSDEEIVADAVDTLRSMFG